LCLFLFYIQIHVAFFYRGQDVRPPGGFMSYFANEPQNSHLVGAALFK
jgi:hypothetical protein